MQRQSSWYAHWHDRRRWALAGIVCALILVVAATPQLYSALAALGSSSLQQVPRYSLFELTFPYTHSYSNPYDPAVVDVEAVFTAPSGARQSVPGFYFQNFTRSGSAQQETLTLVSGSDAWKVRFAPSEIGTYTYVVTRKDSSGTTTLGSGSFQSVASSNHGFVRAQGDHYVFDNGQPFTPLGINAPWFQPSNGHPGYSWGDGTYGVDNMYKMFQANGLNFFQFWTCSMNNDGSTWAKPNIGCGPNNTMIPTMSQPDSWDIDYMVNLAEQDNIFILPVIQHNDQKDQNSGTQAAVNIKSRYFVARYGWSTQMFGWDLSKEGATSPSVQSAWTNYMTQVDPYHHLLTTNQWDHYPTLSTSDLNVYNQVFSNPQMTVVQTHDYTEACNDDFNNDPGFYLFTMKLNATDPRHFGNFGKPSFFGETGVQLGNSMNPCTGTPYGDNSVKQVSPFYDTDHSGLMLKSEAWGAFMGGSAALPWIYRFDPNGTWTQLAAYQGLSKYVAALPPVPDSAVLFTSYQDTAQVTTSDSRLRVIGRKNASFAMFQVQNTTGTALQILSGATPASVNGSVNLKNMQAGALFTVRWLDTTTGAVVSTVQGKADTAGQLQLSLPAAMTQNVAAIVTLSTTPTPTPTPGTTPPPQPTSTPGVTPSPQPSPTACPGPDPSGPPCPVTTPTPSPTPGLGGTPLTNSPCAVLLNGQLIQGTCTGTYGQ